MLEEANQKRKAMVENMNPKKKNKKSKKKKRKYKRYSGLPMYGGVPPMAHMMQIQQMYGGMPPPGPGNLNYPLYYNNGGPGTYSGYGQNMSGLAGAGLNALNGTPPNGFLQEINNMHSKICKNPAEFEDRNKIVSGRDINDDNKDQLKLLLSQQLGKANVESHRDRPPSQN